MIIELSPVIKEKVSKSECENVEPLKLIIAFSWVIKEKFESEEQKENVEPLKLIIEFSWVIKEKFESEEQK